MVCANGHLPDSPHDHDVAPLRGRTFHYVYAHYRGCRMHGPVCTYSRDFHLLQVSGHLHDRHAGGAYDRHANSLYDRRAERLYVHSRMKCFYPVRYAYYNSS